MGRRKAGPLPAGVPCEGGVRKKNGRRSARLSSGPDWLGALILLVLPAMLSVHDPRVLVRARHGRARRGQPAQGVARLIVVVQLDVTELDVGALREVEAIHDFPEVRTRLPRPAVH